MLDHPHRHHPPDTSPPACDGYPNLLIWVDRRPALRCRGWTYSVLYTDTRGNHRRLECTGSTLACYSRFAAACALHGVLFSIESLNGGRRDGGSAWREMVAAARQAGVDTAAPPPRTPRLPTYTPRIPAWHWIDEMRQRKDVAGQEGADRAT